VEAMMLLTPFYDPEKSYEENFTQGPFGAFADEVVFEQAGEPKHEFLGHTVYLPFGIPAGPLLNSKFVRAAFEKGFDITTYKTVRTRAYGCHPFPNVLAVKVAGDLSIEQSRGSLVADNHYQKPLSITNSFGVPSMNPDVWQADMEKAVKSAGVGQVMVGSFQGTSDGSGNFDRLVEDYVVAARLVKETGVRVLEANLSCPNEGKADLLCFDVEGVEQLSRAIKDEIGDTPLLLKLAYFEDNVHLEKLVRAVGGVVEGLAVINTIPAAIVDTSGEQALPGEGRLRSGVCGRAIRWAGLEMTKRLAQLRERLGMNLTIVGVGGVTEAGDYERYREMGADVVMSATGAMWNSLLAQEIKEVQARNMQIK